MLEGRDQALIDYYSRRAHEYDRIYERPERQADLAELRRTVVGWLRGRRVLEIACGTGYWTEVLAPVVSSLVATDASAGVLEVARSRLASSSDPPIFREADAFDLASVPGDFDAVAAGFWLSHLARAEIPRWRDALHERLGAGARVVLFDNRFAEGSSSPISRWDESGDSFQVRRLESGEEHEVRKNFFEEPELQQRFSPGATELLVHESTYYWAVRYVIAAPSSTA
jgi:demethylmenaquinone methyltransferase/2-methoxy-6-polyprenyl-1,4-benzoquinol methylase